MSAFNYFVLYHFVLKISSTKQQSTILAHSIRYRPEKQNLIIMGK